MSNENDARHASGGQVLVGVIMIMLVLLIMIPALVQWTQVETRASVKNQKSTTAFNLAEAAVERGYWKIQSTTSTWYQASTGTAISGYEFDTTYTDVSGGSYRILVTSGPASGEATITGEGRDSASQETRSIKAVFKNQTIYSPLMATQGINLHEGLLPMWGPIMSQGNINITDDFSGNFYYPRKFAKGIVACNGGCTPGGAVGHARDTNGLTPPNTDNQEWWSDYQSVPPLPVLDFAALRSSAAATGTLNVYGCKNSTVYTSTVPYAAQYAGAAPWDKRAICTNTGAHSQHFSASYMHPYGAQALPNNNSYVWYWDGDVILGGNTTNNQPPDPVNAYYAIGLRGTVIVRGNMTLDATGVYNYTGNVPVNAWAEYGLLNKGNVDTAATGEYPADNGFQKNQNTWTFGTGSANYPGFGSGYNTVGIRGFTYVGGNLNITSNGYMDFNGAVWVNGTVNSLGAVGSNACGVFFDDSLVLPTLNVILVRQSWNEIAASTWTWH